MRYMRFDSTKLEEILEEEYWNPYGLRNFETGPLSFVLKYYPFSKFNSVWTDGGPLIISVTLKAELDCSGNPYLSD